MVDLGKEIKYIPLLHHGSTLFDLGFLPYTIRSEICVGIDDEIYNAGERRVFRAVRECVLRAEGLLISKKKAVYLHELVNFLNS